MKDFDVISIGSAARDVFLGDLNFIKLSGEQFPTGQGIGFDLGSKYEAKKLVLTTGGGGTNTAVTFARQGLKTACIGAIADDLNGQEILKELEVEGVDVSLFQKHEGDYTAYSVILVDPSAERTILSYKGEGQHLEGMSLNLDDVKTKWFFVSSLGGHVEVLHKVVTWATANGAKLAINPGTKELALGLSALAPLMKNFSIVFMNQEEAAQLLGVPFTDEETIFKKMDELIGGIFVMTNGHEGVKVSDGQHIWSAGVPDSPVVERTGAGDGFAAAFVAEYSRSGDISKSIQIATANASSVVTQYGAKAGILKTGDNGPWPLVEVSQK